MHQSLQFGAINPSACKKFLKNQIGNAWHSSCITEYNFTFGSVVGTQS